MLTWTSLPLPQSYSTLKKLATHGNKTTFKCKDVILVITPLIIMVTAVEPPKKEWFGTKPFCSLFRGHLLSEVDHFGQSRHSAGSVLRSTIRHFNQYTFAKACACNNHAHHHSLSCNSKTANYKQVKTRHESARLTPSRRENSNEQGWSCVNQQH